MGLASLLDDVERTGNLLEAGFWMLFGAAVTLALWKWARGFTASGLVPGLLSVLFGLSDLAEARTGAWWRPWRLLLWKAACLSGMGLCLLMYVRGRSARTPESGPPQPPSSM